MVYVHQKTINWSDTDAAEIVYTGNYLNYSLEAIEGWFKDVIGLNWYELNNDQKMGTPFVHIEMNIKSMLTPMNSLEIYVYVEKMGKSSIAYKIIGKKDREIESFNALLVCCIINRPDNKVIAIPDDYREKINNYISRC